jgi:hypothetical protein
MPKGRQMSDQPQSIAPSAAIDRLIGAGLASRSTIHGINESEIAKVESVAGRSLPASYRRFLELAGREAGSFLRGSHFFFPEVLDLRAYAEELLAERRWPFRLATSDFVFFMHQGYLFDFMTGDREEADVLAFHEGDSGPKVAAPNFGTWLSDAVNDELYPRFADRSK